MKLVNSILLIDDEMTVNLRNYSLIKKLNVSDNITFVQNVEAAIEYLFRQNKCPDLILLDLNMPNIDGYVFLDLLNYMKFKGYKDSLVFVMHECVELIDVRKLFNTGIKGVLVKPLTIETIKGILKYIKA